MSSSFARTVATRAAHHRRFGTGRWWRRTLVWLLAAFAVPCAALGVAALSARAWLRMTYPPTAVVDYRVVEGGSLTMHLFEPSYRTTSRRAAIVLFFGGFWSIGAPEQFYPFARYFADRGFVALAVDYRVRWRHGTNVFTAASDATAALRWVAEHADALHVDPARIVMAGGSSGGHVAAAAALGLTGERAPAVAALVLFNPAVDTSFDDVPAVWRIVEPLFETQGRALSPLHRLQRGTPPTLIFHGRSDRIVPVEQSRRFCKAIRDLGGICDLREIGGAGHAFFNYGFGHFDEVAAGSVEFLTRTFDGQVQHGVR